MIGMCFACNKWKDLTKHHIIGKRYNGEDNPENLIPDICRECHDELERNLNVARGFVGAGRESEVPKSFQLGQVTLRLQIGSVLIDDKNTAIIDSDSAIYGMSVHNKLIGERHLEACLSGSMCAVITGSPPNSGVVYALSKES